MAKVDAAGGRIDTRTKVGTMLTAALTLPDRLSATLEAPPVRQR
jgi:hypothetical protein